jgi:uncharacterized membrane protein YphA (DoxX/SURF4 family)
LSVSWPENSPAGPRKKSTRFFDGLHGKAPCNTRGFSFDYNSLALLLLAALLTALTTLLAALARVLGLLTALAALLTALLTALLLVFVVRIVGHELAPWSVTSPSKANALLRASFRRNFPASCMCEMRHNGMRWFHEL